MKKPLTLHKAAWVLCAFALSLIITAYPTARAYAGSLYHPIERYQTHLKGEYGDYYEAQRQRVDLYLFKPTAIDTLIISNTPRHHEASATGDWRIADIDLFHADRLGLLDKNTAKDQPLPEKIVKREEEVVYVIHRGQVVFSSRDIAAYDFIKFKGVCTDSDSRQQLQFSLSISGNGMGETKDMLFVYADPSSNTLRHHIIEDHYTTDPCGITNALLNKAQEKQLINGINTVYQTIRPPLFTEMDEYATSTTALPTLRFSNSQFESILDTFKTQMAVLTQFQTEMTAQKNSRVDEETGDREYINYYKSSYVIEDLAENTAWKVIEVAYLQLYDSWAVFLAQNKQSGEWTAFYSSSGGDSNRHLYIDTNVELTGNTLSGRFRAFASHQYEIRLSDFSVAYKASDSTPH